MNKYRITVFAALFALFSIDKANSQNEDASWIIGIGSNYLYDNGSGLKQLFDIQNSWHGVIYPSLISLEKKTGKNFSLVTIGTFNKYKPGKTVNGHENPSPRNYYAFDLVVKYNLNDLFWDNDFFDPFILAGYGFYYLSPGQLSPEQIKIIPDYIVATKKGFIHNLGGGFNVWVTKEIGINFTTMTKWGFTKITSNHLQSTVGVIYKFNGDKNHFFRFRKKNLPSIE